MSLLCAKLREIQCTDLRTALRKVCEVWLISMPVAACQLVLLTAAEGQTLVGSDLFASSLPLAASGKQDLCTCTLDKYLAQALESQSFLELPGMKTLEMQENVNQSQSLR